MGRDPSSDQIHAAHYIALSETESAHDRADYGAWMHHYVKALGVTDDQVDEGLLAWSEPSPKVGRGLMSCREPPKP
jgi:hypothetical protein